jgi:peptidoglycan/xylan/chitin deacetylase (PgdA/CDA1 family)
LKAISAIAACATALILVAFFWTASSKPAIASGCNCVAFRLDDIQDYFLNEVQIETMQVFDRRNVSLTAGIIGNYFGSDQKVLSYVREKAGNGSLEVANHGWNHEDFTVLDMEEQSALIGKTNGKIIELLSIQPEIFIAPYNVANSGTFAAAEENGIRYFSANVTYDPPPYDIYSNADMYHLPSTALMGDLNDDDTEWITFSHEKVFSDIKASIRDYGFAVVTMHPQDFAEKDKLAYQNKVDPKYMEELELLLDLVQKEDIKIVKMSEVNSVAEALKDS